MTLAPHRSNGSSMDRFISHSAPATVLGKAVDASVGGPCSHMGDLNRADSSGLYLAQSWLLQDIRGMNQWIEVLSF